MRIRTRLIAVAVSVLTAVSMMAGCGSSSSSEPREIVAKEEAAEKAEAKDAGEQQDAQAEAGAEGGQEGGGQEGGGQEGEGQVDPSGQEAEDATTIEEQILIDRDGIRVTAKQYVTDSIWGEGIKVLIENNSDIDVMVGCDALIVNGYMISDLFSADVAAGKKANDTIYLSSSELKAAGIDVVGRVEIYFHAYDSDSYDSIFGKESAVIETSAIDRIDTKANDDGVELYNEGGIRIVGKTVDENSFWGMAILLYMENDSGRDAVIQVEDLSVNGFMMTPYFSADVYDGKKALDDITLMSSELEENGIESIEDVELKFHIYDPESYDTIADSDIISFSAKQ